MEKTLNEEIRLIVLKALNCKEYLKVEDDTDLTLIGMDSLVFIDIVEKLEERYKCEIDDEKLFIPQMNTIRKLVSIMNETLSKH